jgi:hypothetical protein
MAQRHDGGYGEGHEDRLREQYGGRSREPGREFRGRHEGWERLRRAESQKYGQEGEGYPRFGSRRYGADFERDEDRGAFAGRGYEEPGWRRGEVGGREHEGHDWGRGRWGQGSDEGDRGEQRSEPRFGSGHEGYGERERGRFDQPGAGGRFDQRFGGYGDAYGGYEGRRRYGESPGRGFGRGFGDYGGDLGGYGREGAGRGGAQSWREGGRFSGRGPKGYRRSDERIREEVCDILTADPDIDASDITVQVTSCEVLLEGTVDDRWTKRHAEDVIEGVSGVNQVHNRLQVRSGSQTERQGEQQSAGTSRLGNGSRSTTGQS